MLCTADRRRWGGLLYHLSMPTQTVFLLSPAHCGGRRARMLLRPEADFPLARALREGAQLGDVFAFLSGLYFRGKLAYARAFAWRAAAPEGVLVIAPGLGLVPPETVGLHAIAEVGVDLDEPRFREPFARDAAALAGVVGEDATVVLLGSIASDKYVAVLQEHLGRRLLFPSTFVGRGDMSRGGLLLRAVRSGEELAYEPVAGAVRRGKRPPRLVPLR